MNSVFVVLLFFAALIHAEYILSIILGRNDIADFFWGPGIAFLSVLALIIGSKGHSNAYLFTVLSVLWATRLGWHILQRLQKHPEDKRYQQWRKDWGKMFYLRSYFQVFLLQGLLQIFIATPALVFMNTKGSFTTLSLIGTLVWCFGFYFEMIADKQLKQFLQNPTNKGKLLQSGLWAYSRHPNYFGEVVQWWGLWILTLSTPFWALALMSPITITILILAVSGIPLLEKSLSLHPDFAEYKRRVSVFIPLPPKK